MTILLSVVVRWSLAVLLVPCVWAVLHQLLLMGNSLGQEGLRSWWRYAAGAAGYLMVERLIRKPIWLYVVGHELTHAVSGLMTGAQVYSFKAGARGGEVRLSKSNAFIALSPYIIPFYAVGILAIYAVIQLFWPRQEATWAFQVLLGMALAFHVSLTISAFHGHQSDLKVLGFFLSGTLIVLGNGLILGVLGVSLFAKTPTLPRFAASIAAETTGIWMKGIGLMAEEAKKRFENHRFENPRPEQITRRG